MTRIAIDAREFEAAARELSRQVFAAMNRRALNRAGSKMRRELIPAMVEQAQTSRRALGPKARAVPPGAEPDRAAYRLRLNRSVPVGMLRSGARRVRRRKGKARLHLRQLDGGRSVFVVRRADDEAGGRRRARFRLPEKGGLPERALGGIAWPRDLRRFSTLRKIIDATGEDYAASMEEQLAARLNRRRRRG